MSKRVEEIRIGLSIGACGTINVGALATILAEHEARLPPPIDGVCGFCESADCDNTCPQSRGPVAPLPLCAPPGNLPECGAWHDHYNRCRRHSGHEGYHHDGDRIRWDRGTLDSTERPEKPAERPAGEAKCEHGEFPACCFDCHEMQPPVSDPPTPNLETCKLFGPRCDHDGEDPYMEAELNGAWIGWQEAEEAARLDILADRKSQAEAHAREREADRKELAEVKTLLHEQTLATSQALKEAEAARLKAVVEVDPPTEREVDDLLAKWRAMCAPGSLHKLVIMAAQLQRQKADK